MADDVYGHDHWYALTQTASIQISTQTLQESGQPTNARLNQNQAAAQRMGYACILEAKEVQKLRGQVLTFRPRVRISNSQSVHCAVLAWTGTADAVTSDVVTDWTSTGYSTGAGFFITASGNLGTEGAQSLTPAVNTWADLPALTFTVGGTVNNLILFVWTTGTAAQNVTLDIGKVRLVPGDTAGEIYIPTFDETLRYAMRFFEKTFQYTVAPAQNAGGLGALAVAQAVGASATTRLSWRFLVPKCEGVPTTTGVTYNPAAGNAHVRNDTTGTDCSGTSVLNAVTNMLNIEYVTPGGSAAGQLNWVHATASRRL